MNLILVLYLILIYLVLNGADTAKLRNRTQEIAFHPDYKKIEFIWDGRVSIESSLRPKIIWEQEVNSKKSEKKPILTKTDLLSKSIRKCNRNVTAR